MVFRTEMPVPWGAIDQAGIVYYPQFLHFCHMAMEALFADEMGISYADAVKVQEVGYPTVHSTCEFQKPVPYGETLRMQVSVDRIGTSSIVLRYEGFRQSDGALAFRVVNTQVAVAMAPFTSTPIPDDHRTVFERLRTPTEDEAS